MYFAIPKRESTRSRALPRLENFYGHWNRATILWTCTTYLCYLRPLRVGMVGRVWILPVATDDCIARVTAKSPSTDRWIPE